MLPRAGKSWGPKGKTFPLLQVAARNAGSLLKLKRRLKSSAELFPQPMPLRTALEQKLKDEIEEKELALKSIQKRDPLQRRAGRKSSQ